MNRNLSLLLSSAALLIAVTGCGGKDKQEQKQATSEEKADEVSYYDPIKDECKTKDGSGIFINFTKGFGQTEHTCNTIFANENLGEYGKEKEAEYPGALIAPNKYDMAILSSLIDKEREEEASASQKRLEDWAVRSAEAEQRHQEKCQDQLENRGYGDPGCY